MNHWGGRLSNRQTQRLVIAITVALTLHRAVSCRLAARAHQSGCIAARVALHGHKYLFEREFQAHFKCTASGTTILFRNKWLPRLAVETFFI